MTATHLRCALILSLGLSGATAAAAAPVTYDCDTNEGSYSSIEQVQAGPTYHVRGTITPRQWREHERFLPSAQVRLESRDGSRAIAVQMIRDHGAAQARFGVQSTQGTAVETLGEAAIDQAVPFDISVLASGDAVVALGAERRVFHLDLGRGAKVKVICSTGEFEFSDLDWTVGG